MKIFKQILESITDDNVRKHYKYLILIFVLIILYISNGLIYSLALQRQNKLNEDLLRAKAKYNMKLKDFMKFGNYKNIIDLSNKYDLQLEEPDTPPIKVEK